MTRPGPTQSHFSRRQRGITMIELIVVVVILGMLLTLSAPSVKRMVHKGQLRGEVRNLVTLLKYARSEAISRNHPVEVRFDLYNHVYRLDLRLNNIPANVRQDDNMPLESEERVIELPVNQVQFTAILTYEQKRNRRYGEQQSERGRRSPKEEDGSEIVVLRFYPRGTATGASIVLQSVEENREDEKYMTVDLFSTTGRIEVYYGKPEAKTTEAVSQYDDGSDDDQTKIPYYRRKNR